MKSRNFSFLFTFQLFFLLGTLLSCRTMFQDKKKEPPKIQNNPPQTSKPKMIESNLVPVQKTAADYEKRFQFKLARGGDQRKSFSPGMVMENDISLPGRYNPNFNTENYSYIEENSFFSVTDKPLSTFSADVDTASYSNVRRFLQSGSLPPKDSVRLEELINYFDYSYPHTDASAPLQTHIETSHCPWNTKNILVKIGVQAKKLDQANIPARNLVFLIDVSGSMYSSQKLPLLKQAIKLLVKQLKSEDRVSIVVYAGAAGLVLPATAGSDQNRILASLEKLTAGGSTNGGEGILLAYKEAKKNFIPNGINRVILASDGDFNVGVSSHGELQRLIEKQRQSGIYLTVLGFGMGNYKDSTMENLANRGNGNYAYIDNLNEARKVLVTQAGATLVTVAKDVKFQVEFNPQRVAAYRLIGYENRKLQAKDFNDDKKDAGEIGAGHTVTVLYEITPTGRNNTFTGTIDPLKYQTPPQNSQNAYSQEWFTVKLRYKKPDSDTSTLLTFPYRNSDLSTPALANSSDNMRFAAAVASFGMLLRDSTYKGQANYQQTYSLAKSALGNDEHGYRAEFLQLIRLAQQLQQPSAPTSPERRERLSYWGNRYP